jgi:hypothetical protein
MAKWKKISMKVMATKIYHHYKKNPTCKDKWIIVLGDYHMIKNYINIVGVNEDYWVLSTQNKSSLDFLFKYFKEIYEIIESLNS